MEPLTPSTSTPKETPSAPTPEPQPKPRPGGLDGAIIMVGTLSIWITAFLVLGYTAPSFGLDIDGSSTIAVALMITIQSTAFIAGPFLFGILYRKLKWVDFGLVRPKPVYLAIGAVSGIVLAPLASILAEQINPDLKDILVNSFMPDEATPLRMLAMFVTAGLLTPFAEELLFRGVLLGFLKNLLGVWPAIVISAAVFGLIHIEPTWALVAGCLGAYMGFLYVRAGSLWASVAFHMAYNSTGLVLLYTTN